MNSVCHGEERSDVAIQLEFRLDCRARQAGLAMTNLMSSLAGAARCAATAPSSQIATARLAMTTHLKIRAEGLFRLLLGAEPSLRILAAHV